MKIVFSFELLKKLSLVLSVLVLLTFVGFILSETGFFGLVSFSNTGNDSNNAETSVFVADLNKKAFVVKGLQVFEVVDFNCFDCIKLDALKSFLERYGIDVNSVSKTLNFKDSKARELIKEYNIKKIPSLIVLGDLSGTGSLKRDWNFIGTIEGDNALVARNFLPPYLDLESGKVKGVVKMIMLTDSNNCSLCANPLSMPLLFNFTNNIFVKDGLKVVEASSSEGKELIQKYRIEFVPTLIFSPEVRDYNFFSQVRGLGTIEADDFFVVREKLPPFLELETKRLRGLADAIVIQYSGCWLCFNAKDLVLGLQNNVGLRFRNISVLDANTENAKNLVKNFSLKYLPAAIIGGDLAVYPNFEDIWNKVGRTDQNLFVLDSNTVLGPGFYVEAKTLQPVQSGIAQQTSQTS